MDAPRLVRDEARALVASFIRPEDRVLVTGATGWFGTTMLALLADLPSERLHLVASRAREVTVADRAFRVRAWAPDEIRAFDPTIVLNFAFLTRGKEVDLGAQAYAAANIELSHRFDLAANLPSVRLALTCSSGAALVTPEGIDEPIGSYGRVKAEEEVRALALASAARSVVVARAWSLSGTLVQQVHGYAFSDLVLQARTGEIRVTADCEVWRRYCGVDDYLAVCLARGAGGWSGVIDSGGEEVELRALARRIADRFEGRRPSVETLPATGPVRRYLSDDVTWQAACAALGYYPAGLDDQIDAVQRALA